MAKKAKTDSSHDEMWADVEQDRAEVARLAPDDQRLKSVADLASKQVLYEQEVDRLEGELKKAQAALLEVQTKELPDAMQAIGLETFTLANGLRISIKDDVSISIPKDMRSQAYAWLRRKGYGNIVKTEVSVSFGKGEDKAADKAVAVLLKSGFNPQQDDSVHSSTLKAFAKEARERNIKLPAKFFSVWYYSKAMVGAK